MVADLQVCLYEIMLSLLIINSLTFASDYYSISCS